MSKIMLLFQYIHYRFYDFFRDRGDDTPEFTATLVLSLLQFLTLIDIVFAIQLLYYFPLPSKLYFLPLLLGIPVLNWFRFEKSFDIVELDEKWRREKFKKRLINGWLILIYLLLVLLFPVVLGILYPASARL
ncbi:hypothetical protein QWY31_16345 [Cytophagales bacterium LB-30]|uniref:DUF805 domain-containing protein n=1 Tax=Shiella aurantiaca TaxID=3058365 RepID=A0ABT8F9C0_9BACT|nr:hypothetical protein [Shiella aurantiaca]MDN4167082.1 hypothetical protein [Shiella aurantiaca]